METRDEAGLTDDGRRTTDDGRRTTDDAQSKVQSPKSKVQQSPDAAAMRKGVYLSALIYIEGSQAPPENFTATAKAALKARLASKQDSAYDALEMTLKKVEQTTDVDEDDDGSGDGKRSAASGKAKAAAKKLKEDKFEF